MESLGLSVCEDPGILRKITDDTFFFVAHIPNWYALPLLKAGIHTPFWVGTDLRGQEERFIVELAQYYRRDRHATLARLNALDIIGRFLDEHTEITLTKDQTDVNHHCQFKYYVAKARQDDSVDRGELFDTTKLPLKTGHSR